MSYLALYRQWRPLTFTDVIEQEHVVSTLKWSVRAGRIAHAYLFCGTRGTGKTTMAKIFARAVNCLDPREGDPCNACVVCRGILDNTLLDVMEIDAASNNSVDNVRAIRDEVVYAPTQARYKVYIIDEVHMLSSGAFNALLKTLEEPPSHVMFILATTEPHKLPATILSRCQRFDFKRITTDSIAARVGHIAGESHVRITPEAARLIARLAEGAMRDALSLLDQCMATGATTLSAEDVTRMIGIAPEVLVARTAQAVAAKDIPELLASVEAVVQEGKDLARFVEDLLLFFRHVLVAAVTERPEALMELDSDTLSAVRGVAATLQADAPSEMLRELSQLLANLKWSSQPRALMEAGLIRLCRRGALSGGAVPGGLGDRLAEMEARIKALENRPLAVAAPASSGLRAPEPVAVPAKKTIHPLPGITPGMPVRPVECFEEILRELKGLGRMNLYTNLLGARAVLLDDHHVALLYGEGSAFKKMLVSRAENTEYLEERFAKALGHVVRVRCLDEKELAEPTPPAEDTFLKKAEDIARRMDVPFDIVDE